MQGAPQNPAEELLSLPTYLHGPPRPWNTLPVETRIQELPFGELAWEDFEKLCCRLAGLEANVTHCQLYGIRGQMQEGIDLFATTVTSSKYRVYQCKREDGFDHKKIKKAVTKFLGGQWVSKTEQFVLCTKESLIERRRADELQAQRTCLKSHGIALGVWDSQRLSTMLKDLPRLVDDFFGRAWVKAFCGFEASLALGNRLDVTEVADFRRRMGDFYARVFDKHDPGLPVSDASEGSSLRLLNRYVVADVLEYRMGGFVHKEGADGGRDTVGTVEPELNRGKADVELAQRPGEYTGRKPVDEWLSSISNSLLLAGPGGGKSSLLRFIALDLLGDSPRLSPLVKVWGNHLPVWVSFPLWTRLIATEQQQPCSLKRLVELWLHAWDEERLLPLVEKAVEDDRLLLLVDGLDEWASEGTARIALDRLRVFVEQRGVPSVAVCRPHGYRRLGVHPSGWKVAELAGLSADQQRQLATSWFQFRESVRADSSGGGDGLSDQRARREADALLSELSRSADLGALAQTPLLLTLLIYHRMHQVQLPQSRFRAYESLVDHLISVHPHRRRAAANDATADSELSGDEIRQSLACLAFRIQKDGGEAIQDQDGVRQVEGFLRDVDRGPGLEAGEARKLAKRLVEVGETSLGLLVRRSPTAVGFLHRTFQELLAAAHLSRSPLGEQTDVFRQYCSDSRWREVLLGLLHCNKRTHEVRALADVVRGTLADCAAEERMFLESLLAEAAFGEFNCPANLARELATETFRVIETGPRMTHRQVLLGHALGGLNSTKVREQVRAKLRSWFPCYDRHRADVFQAMEKWPAEPEVIECLWRAIHDEEPDSRRAAARTFARLGGNDDKLGHQVVALARVAEDPGVRAVAVDALVRGWPNIDQAASLLAVNRHSAAPEVRMAVIRGNMTLGNHETTDRDELLRLGTVRSGLHHSWRKELSGMLVEGWSGDLVVKNACLTALRVPRHERQVGLDSEVAWPTLLLGFQPDNEIAEVLCIRIQRNDLFSAVFDDARCWPALGAHVRANAMLAESLCRWQAEQENAELEFIHSALFTRTDTAKAKLLDWMVTGIPHWAASALLDGWGMRDQEVAAGFARKLAEPPAALGWVAHLLPRVITDPVECRVRLLGLLRDPACRRPDFVLDGLNQLGGVRPDREVVDIVLGDVLHRPDVIWMDRDRCIPELLKAHHGDPRVRDLAKRQFDEEFPQYAAIAAAFPADREIRGLLIERLTPLPKPLRMLISSRLPQESPDASFALELLGLYDREKDQEVKCQASLSYWGLVKAAGIPGEDYLERLSRDILRLGPEMEEQRQAAFCGLATVGRLDLMKEARDTGDRICAITVYRGIGQNVPLVKCILENWEDVTRIFGDETYRRLNHRNDKGEQLWFRLLPFADEYPAARRDALQFLESREDSVAGHNGLLFLGRTMPKSRRLLECCLKALHVGEDGVDTGGPTAVVAAELVGGSFHGDPDVLKTILAGNGGEYCYEKTILCLCEGWETCSYLDRVYELTVAGETGLRGLTWHRLLCSKGDSEQVARLLMTLAQGLDTEPSIPGSLVARPFVRRIRKDKALAERLVQALFGTPSSAEKATLPRLLTSAQGLRDDVRSWCQAELARQFGGGPIEFGYDLTAGEIRAVSQSLLDVLLPSVDPEVQFSI